VPAVIRLSTQLCGLIKVRSPQRATHGSLALSGVTFLSGVVGRMGTDPIQDKARHFIGAVFSPPYGPRWPSAPIGLSIATDPILGAIVTGTLNRDTVTIPGTLRARTPPQLHRPVDTRYTADHKGPLHGNMSSKPQGVLDPRSSAGRRLANLNLERLRQRHADGQLPTAR